MLYWLYKCHPFHTSVQRILGLRRAKHLKLPLFGSKMQITTNYRFTWRLSIAENHIEQKYFNLFVSGQA